MGRSVWRIAVMTCLPVSLALSPAAPAEASGPFHKLARGVANTAMGWVEVPAQVGRGMETQGSVGGVAMGAARGILFGVGRTLIGVVEIATFPFPNREFREKDSDPYGPLIQPEFVILRDADLPA